MNNTILEVTQNIVNRSKKNREIYLSRISKAKKEFVSRKFVGCSNLAHAVAAMNEDEKASLLDMTSYNMGIITAYNDMLSAHQPYEKYPQLLKNTLHNFNSTAQVSSGVPAMCDGVTQGQIGMELSLFSRDTIAMASAVGLSHDVYDGAFYLGICDKIVPGLFIAASSFGHLPSIFVPGGPMPSGISNKEKAKVREEYAQGKADESSLLKAETSSYHTCGTCTFYGTANSNQMFLEMMGLQLPNSSFVNTNTPLREELSKKAAEVLVDLANEKISMSDIISEKSFVNAIVGLMATGGSSNHTIHLIAMAKSCGIILTWEDFDAIAKVVPLLCKLYPNGSADVNHFRDAGGMGVVINELLKAELVHNDVQTVIGFGLENYVVEPKLEEGNLRFISSDMISSNSEVISNMQTPYSKEGGLKLLEGVLGQSIIKTSALKKEHLYIKAPAIVFHSQEALQEAFADGKLEKDFIAVVSYQGPKSNGMPELHKLMPPLGVLQEKGFKVGIITDGRMSGASGKVPSAIHLSPEAVDGGLISKIQDGDLIEFDIENGIINILVDIETLEKRETVIPNLDANKYGLGRELFVNARANVCSAREGATIFKLVGEEDV
jgi:phosphogluconate dehydratase